MPPAKKTSNRASKPRSSREPRTMDELLAKTGYVLRGLQRGSVIEGKVVAITGRTLILDIGGKAEGIITDKSFDEVADFIRTLSVGDKVKAKVVVPEGESGNALLSLRDTAAQAAWETLERKYESQEPVEVIGKGVTRGGITVSCLGVTGFIPTSHLGTDASKNPQGLMDKTIKAKVIELAREDGRLVLSEKAVSEAELLRAQEKALGKIKEGEVYEGEVVGLTDFGAFVRIEVEIKKGEEVSIEGLVHLSEISWEKVDDPANTLSEGQKVKVKVIGVEPEAGRLALSIRQTEEDPWSKVEKKYKKDSKVTGIITKVTEYGAFVELEPGVEGLIHLSKIPVGVSFKTEDAVSCFVEDVDQEGRRISLGLVLKEKPIGYR